MYLLCLFAAISFSLYCYSAAYSIWECPGCCVCEKDDSEIRLRCSCLPEIIPDNTTHFILHEVKESHAFLDFSHQSWATVKVLILQVHVWRESASIANSSFLGVPDLETLRISNFRNLREIPTGTFRHLQKLKELDLCDNRYLSFSGLSTVFPDLQNIHLEALKLCRTNKYDIGSSGAIVDVNYFKSFPRRSLKILDISWIGRVFIDAKRSVEHIDLVFPHLEVLNISHSFIIPSDKTSFDTKFDFSRITPLLKQFVSKGWYSVASPRTGIGDCVVNGTDFFYDRYYQNCPLERRIAFPPQLESINIDVASTFNGRCVEFQEERTHCIYANNLKTFSIKHAGITGWNWILIRVNNLDTLDLRHNRLRLITDTSLRYIPSLKKLLLGSNHLWKYQNNGSFEGLLKYSVGLQTIDLSQNNLTWIPRLFFVNNTNLEVIDLSDNGLTTLSFRLGYLLKLKILNLSSNLISTLAEWCLVDIQTVAVTNDHPFIDISHNRITCSCDSKSFIGNLYDISKSLISFESYKCTYKTRIVTLHTLSLAALNEDCVLRIITMTLPPACVALIVLIVAVIIYLKRVYIIKAYVACRFWRYRKKLIKVEDRVFLAYSHNDRELVFTGIYKELESRLKRLLGTDEDILYINDKHFALPGLIDEEIVTAVSSCKCTLALISKSFIESNWAHLEVSYSWSIKRPIVLVFLDDTKENELNGILRYLYNKNVRLVWHRNAQKEDKEVFWANLLRGLVQILDFKLVSRTTRSDDVDINDAEDTASQISSLL